MADNRSSWLLMSSSGPVGATSRVPGGAGRSRGLGLLSLLRVSATGVGTRSRGQGRKPGGCRPRARGWRLVSGSAAALGGARASRLWVPAPELRLWAGTCRVLVVGLGSRLKKKK
jgi:hypothetical protein